MKRILKYRLPIDGQVLTITDNVMDFLEIHCQHGWPHIWAIVDEDVPANFHHEIVAWGTGWDVPKEVEDCGYLGTAIDKAGYVWHYFTRSYATFTTSRATVDWDYMNKLAGTSAGNPVDLYSINITCDGADATIAQKDLHPYTLTVEGSISTPEWAYSGTAGTINCSNRAQTIIGKALAETQGATACTSSVR